MPLSLSQRMPFGVIATAAVAGILAAFLLRSTHQALPPIQSLAAYGGYLFSICCVIATIAYLSVKREQVGFRIAALLVVFVSSGLGYLVVTAEPPGSRIRSMIDSGVIASGEAVVLDASVATAAEPRPDGAYYGVRVERVFSNDVWSDASGTVRIFLADEVHGNSSHRRLDIGTRIEAGCRLFREDRYKNFGGVSSIELLDRSGIDAVCTPRSPDSLSIIGRPTAFYPLGTIYQYRNDAIAAFAERLDPRSAGILIAAMLGDKYYLDKQTADLFRMGGTFHVLVISGLHISFIGGLILLFVGKLTRRRWLHFLASAGVLWGYTLAVGANLPAVRAALMFTLILLGYALYRNSPPLNTLFACVAIILFIAPAQVFDASFQLTFVAVAAIIGFAIPAVERIRGIGEWTPTPATPLPPDVSPIIERIAATLYWHGTEHSDPTSNYIWTGDINKRPCLPSLIGHPIQTATARLFEMLLVSIAVQIAMLPLSVYYFYRAVPFSPLLNIWSGFFLAMSAAVGAIGVAISSVSQHAGDALLALTSALVRLLVWLPETASRLPFADVRTAVYSGNGRIVYYAYLLAAVALAAALLGPIDRRTRRRSFFFRPRNAKWFGVLLGLLGVLIIFHPGARYSDGKLRVSFIDVGQGDAILIETPTGRTLLMDGGGTPMWQRELADERGVFVADVRGVGEMAVADTLFRRGIDRVDIALISHADSDHSAGLAEVVRVMPVDVLLAARIETTGEAAELFDAAARRGTSVEVIHAGMAFELDGVAFEVLHPPAGEDSYDNDNSLVVRIGYGERTFLLTGDIEQNGESAMLARGIPFAADVVKMPHHGSRTSSTQEFVDAVRARYAIVSAGRRSMFGHPHAPVVNRWSASGAIILSTQKSGMITFATNGRELEIETATGE